MGWESGVSRLSLGLPTTIPQNLESPHSPDSPSVLQLYFYSTGNRPGLLDLTLVQSVHNI